MQAESIQPISLILNEQPVETISTNLQFFLAEHGWIEGRFVVVINDNIIAKSAHSTYQLSAGDRIDVLSPISGG
ncbi:MULTISPECIES: sulfur carrier protein ThiS [unclassified Methylophaga]|jgi:sulfur carrier protein|uniref:sulfur carrier protein ThiS n=1 Tax=unclassified Methylophaga TaxID=2629249 RepID=UPI000C92E544|nr:MULTISPECIES: sulfur carrier protein ThiS [unclassified Methylophaga]MAK67671.1 thiamine biosynthesis protein ThiS [Methylophaga sp.]MAY18905.1 thiamine biosynthesis protein ThiS [Methylophaga sp.]HAO23910.1 thiamine biosynthesis protein ThiS [Methylophaga sp.]|tara:strand:+ start:1511 stop:1732 length:222 start_codon:yes stop_codon:yes gene_type:complete